MAHLHSRHPMLILLTTVIIIQPVQAQRQLADLYQDILQNRNVSSERDRSLLIMKCDNCVCAELCDRWRR